MKSIKKIKKLEMLKKELEYKLVVDLSLISQEQSELHLGMQYLTGKRKN
jgi:hypothetical protein